MCVVRLLSCLLNIFYLLDDYTLAPEAKRHVQSHIGLSTEAELYPCLPGKFLFNTTLVSTAMVWGLSLLFAQLSVIVIMMMMIKKNVTSLKNLAVSLKIKYEL